MFRNGRKSLRLCWALAATVGCQTPAAAGNLPPLGDLLGRTAKAAEIFWTHISGVTCTEDVAQEKMGQDGKVLYRQSSLFDYLILMHLVDESISIEESRLLQQTRGGSAHRPLLVTAGFSTMALIFHPYYQNSFRFQYINAGISDNPLARVGFEYVPGTRFPSVLRLKDRDYPLPWRGQAWIEPNSGKILRITAELQGPLPEVGLVSLSCDVGYGEVTFPGSQTSYSLPASASVEAKTVHQHWHNLHHFKNYKQFTVDASTDKATRKEKVPE